MCACRETLIHHMRHLSSLGGPGVTRKAGGGKKAKRGNRLTAGGLGRGAFGGVKSHPKAEGSGKVRGTSVYPACRGGA